MSQLDKPMIFQGTPYANGVEKAAGDLAKKLAEDQPVYLSTEEAEFIHEQMKHFLAMGGFGADMYTSIKAKVEAAFPGWFA